MLIIMLIRYCTLSPLDANYAAMNDLSYNCTKKTYSTNDLILKFDISLQMTRSASFNPFPLPDTHLYLILCPYRQK
ncbi:hypothetical protein [Clostridium phage Amboise]|nr:hypothetical protein [Clostridium phage Amboise]DAH78988.1 MAG TPA: hypothetical protein [Caudoviricetes sp.]